MPTKTFVLKFVQDAGLGNQMFEVAAAHGIARKLGLPLSLVWKSSSRRKFGLGAFGIKLNPPPRYKLVADKMGQGNRLLVEIAMQRVKDCDHPFPAVCCPFQAEECFEGVENEVRRMFTLPPLPLKVPPGCTPVAVQVRKGDYKHHPRLDVVTPTYFVNAMNHMRGHVKSPHFFFTSDDLEWCRRHFGGMSDVTVLDDHGEIEGLRMMLACEAHIISNSTFGWWGAWLAEKGPVVAPDKWHMVPGSYGAWEPVPKRWVRIGGTKKDTMKPLVDVRHYTPLDPLPQTEKAIVIPWKEQAAKWQELRFCLRSIDRFFEDKECPIYILGNLRPGFLLYNKHRVEYINVWSYWEALSMGVQLAQKVAWFNDDIFLLKPTTWEDIAVPYYLAEIQPDFLDKVPPQPNAWRAGAVRVLQLLTSYGIKKHRVYSTHLPYVYERGRALSVLQDFGVWDKMPFELSYFHRYPEGARKITTEKAADHNFGEAQFLNVVDKTLTPEIKQALMNMLPDYAPWELQRKFPV